MTVTRLRSFGLALILVGFGFVLGVIGTLLFIGNLAGGLGPRW